MTVMEWMNSVFTVKYNGVEHNNHVCYYLFFRWTRSWTNCPQLFQIWQVFTLNKVCARCADGIPSTEVNKELYELKVDVGLWCLKHQLNNPLTVFNMPTSTFSLNNPLFYLFNTVCWCRSTLTSHVALTGTSIPLKLIRIYWILKSSKHSLTL